MCLHASAQRRQAAAHAWHCASSCNSHSSAHTSQASAHSPRISTESSLPHAMAATVSLQIAAQSMANLMQRARCAAFVSARQAWAQCSQAKAQSLLCSMQSGWCLEGTFSSARRLWGRVYFRESKAVCYANGAWCVTMQRPVIFLRFGSDRYLGPSTNC